MVFDQLINLYEHLKIDILKNDAHFDAYTYSNSCEMVN